jgi:hypothetical protein
MWLRRRLSSAAMLLTAVVLATLGVGAQTPGTSDALERGFLDPPAAARPRVWWHWMNGNVTKEGITADLEWM